MTCHPLPHKSGWSIIVMAVILEVLDLKAVWKSIFLESGELFVMIFGVWRMEMSFAGAGFFNLIDNEIDHSCLMVDIECLALL